MNCKKCDSVISEYNPINDLCLYCYDEEKGNICPHCDGYRDTEHGKCIDCGK